MNSDFLSKENQSPPSWCSYPPHDAMATFFQRLPEDKTQPPTDAADSVRVLARGASIPRLTENDRIAKYMIAAADVVERHTGSKEGGACLRASAPIIAGVFWVAVKAAPIYALLLQKGKWVYDHAPKDVLRAPPGWTTL